MEINNQENNEYNLKKNINGKIYENSRDLRNDENNNENSAYLVFNDDNYISDNHNNYIIGDNSKSKKKKRRNIAKYQQIQGENMGDKRNIRKLIEKNNEINMSSDEGRNQDNQTIKKYSEHGADFVTKCMNALRGDADSYIKMIENESVLDLKDNLRQFRLQYLAQI